MREGIVAYALNVFDGLYYNVGTELNVIIGVLILLAIMKYMRPRKTQYYIYLPTGMFCAMLIAFMDIILSFAVQYPYNGTNMFIIFLMSINSYLYYTCLVNVVLYIVFLMPAARDHMHIIEISSRIASILFAVITAGVYIISGIKRNTYDIVDLSQYIDFVVYTSFVAMIIVFVFLFHYRRDISHVAARGILLFMPFDFMFLCLQLFQSRAILISLIGILPLLRLYMFFHSNPFDEVIGCQNTYAMEVRFNQNIRDNKEFYFGMLRVPSLVHNTVASDASDDIKTIIELVRELENTYQNLYIFRKTAGEFYMIYEASYTQIHKDEMVHMGLIMRQKVKEIDVTEKCVMVGLEYSPNVKNINMMTDIVQQAIAKYSSQSGSCEKILEATEYDELIDAYYLAELLEKLRDTNTYNNDNVVCYAQPIYEVKTRTFRTAEALMRLYDNGELVSPAVFIPIAETNNCIHFLTICMLHKVCRAIANLTDISDFDAVSINVSVQEFSEANVAREFLDIIASYHVPTSKIRVELTESALANDSDMLAYNMKCLSEAGIRFYLDDFGTGYSSLDRITELPFSVIKFDKSLLYSALKNEKTDKLVRGLVPLLKSDEFVALVEGVEDDVQHSYSIGLGFEYIQGFRWAKPVPIEKLSEYFSSAKGAYHDMS